MYPTDRLAASPNLHIRPIADIFCVTDQSEDVLSYDPNLERQSLAEALDNDQELSQLKHILDQMAATHDHLDDAHKHDAAGMADQLLIDVLSSQLDPSHAPEDTIDALETDTHPVHRQIIAEVQGVELSENEDDQDKENMSMKRNSNAQPIPPEMYVSRLCLESRNLKFGN